MDAASREYKLIVQANQSDLGASANALHINLFVSYRRLSVALIIITIYSDFNQI